MKHWLILFPIGLKGLPGTIILEDVPFVNYTVKGLVTLALEINVSKLFCFASVSAPK